MGQACWCRRNPTNIFEKVWSARSRKSTDGHKENEGREREWMPVIFLLLHFPCCFIPDYSCTCLSDAPQGASGSDWQQGGKWMNELLIWRLWYWGDWRNPNMAGCSLPSLLGPFHAHLMYFFTLLGLQRCRFTGSPPPPLREETLSFHSEEAVMGLYAFVSLSVAIPSQCVRNNIIIEPHFFPKHVQVSNGACKVKRWIVSICKAAGECLPSDLHSGWRHQRLHHWGDSREIAGYSE